MLSFFQTLYEYRAKKNDEHSFGRGELITNVTKEEGGWWKGDMPAQGKKQLWFPANYAVEVDAAEVERSGDPAAAIQQAQAQAQATETPLGNLQKGSIDIIGAKVEVAPILDRVQAMVGAEWLVKIESPNQGATFELAAAKWEDAARWAAKIKETAESASHREDENRKTERALRIARDLSNLVIYCRSVVFNPDK